MSGVTLDILLAVIVLINLVQALRINKLTEEVYLLDRRRQKKEIDDMLEKAELENELFTMDEEN